MNKQNLISYQDLLAGYFYDPDNGIFYRKVKGGNIKCGWTDKFGHKRVRIKNKEFMMHRVIWFYVHGKWPDYEIDHINNDPSDNRICNLRDVPHYINLQNTRGYKKSVSTHPYMGISFHARDKLWCAKIRANGKRISLGYFKKPEDAANAYIAAKRRLHAGCTI